MFKWSISDFLAFSYNVFTVSVDQVDPYLLWKAKPWFMPLHRKAKGKRSLPPWTLVNEKPSPSLYWPTMTTKSNWIIVHFEPTNWNPLSSGSVVMTFVLGFCVCAAESHMRNIIFVCLLSVSRPKQNRTLANKIPIQLYLHSCWHGSV